MLITLLANTLATYYGSTLEGNKYKIYYFIECFFIIILLFHTVSMETFDSFIKICLIAILKCATISDLHYKTVPNRLQVLLFCCFYFLSPSIDVIAAIVVGLGCYVLSIYGFGGADSKFVILVALFFHLYHAIVILWLASILALARIIIKKYVFRKDIHQQIPFIPYLTFSFLYIIPI